MIEIEKIRLSFPDWDWWQVLIAIVFFVMILRGQHKEVLQWIKSFLPMGKDKEEKD